jgi:AcrR family transcriptional regulator
LTKQQQNTEETHKRILRVAEALFMEHGYRAVSTRQVASQCGISQPTLYYHFADKQELYIAVLLDVLQRMKGDLEKIAGAAEEDIEQKLTRLTVYLLEHTGQNMNLRAMLNDIETHLDEVSRQKVRQAFFNSMILPIVSILKTAAPSQEQNPPGLSPVMLAFLFLNMMSTLTGRENQSGPENIDRIESQTEMAAKLTRFYLHGLLNR